MSDLRMPDLNKVQLVGRLTADPELRYLPSGMAVCKLRMAVSRFYKSKDGERREDSFFINVETWNKSAEFCNEYLKKGRPVLVEGRLKSNEWEDKNTGQKRSAIEVVAERVQQLDWDDRGGGAGSSSGGGGGNRPQPRVIEEPLPEDDIPF
ncbi:MAG: single-stranded DNA-binding protein [Candidatus Hydrogenedentota bacterium]